MKGDRQLLQQRLRREISKLDNATPTIHNLKAMQNFTIVLTYNEACAALSAISMLEEYKAKLLTV